MQIASLQAQNTQQAESLAAARRATEVLDGELERGREAVAGLERQISALRSELSQAQAQSRTWEGLCRSLERVQEHASVPAPAPPPEVGLDMAVQELREALAAAELRCAQAESALRQAQLGSGPREEELARAKAALAALQEELRRSQQENQQVSPCPLLTSMPEATYHFTCRFPPYAPMLCDTL